MFAKVDMSCFSSWGGGGENDICFYLFTEKRYATETIPCLTYFLTEVIQMASIQLKNCS